VRSLLEEARIGGVDLDATTLEFTLRKSIERIAERLRDDPADLTDLRALRGAVEMLKTLPFQVMLWAVQNVGYDLLQSTYPEMVDRAETGDEEAAAWVKDFRTIAEMLSLRIE
jgi:hypothetical protein